jgi:hypothetical protein
MSDDEIRCLTLTQPWATLMALDEKRIETRSWPTNYRGLVAIHAAKGLGPVGGNRGLNKLVAREPFWSVLGAAGCTFGRRAPIGLPFGAIVAVGRMTECLPTKVDRGIAYYRLGNGIWWSVSSQERALGNYESGRFAWLFVDMRRFTQPIPAKGARRLWRPDAALTAAIRQAMEGGNIESS